MKTHRWFSGVVFVTEGLVSVIKKSGKRTAYEKGAVVWLKGFLARSQVGEVRFLPLSTATFFVLESQALAEAEYSAPQASAAIYRALVQHWSRTQCEHKKPPEPKEASATAERHSEFVPGVKLTAEEQQTLLKFQAPSPVAQRNASPGSHRSRRSEPASLYKSSLFNWKIERQNEEVRLRRIGKRKLSKSSAAAVPEINEEAKKNVSSPSKTLPLLGTKTKEDIRPEDIVQARNMIKALQTELDGLTVELRRTESDRDRAKSAWKQGREERELLEVAVKKTCLVKEVESSQLALRARLASSEGLKSGAKTLNFGQIVCCQR